MARRGENIYLRKDGRYEGRYIKGRKENGQVIQGYIYGRQYSEVKRKMLVLKARNMQAFKMNPTFAKSDILFAEWAYYWLDVLSKPYIKISTLTNYSRMMKKHLIPALGDIEVQALDMPVIQMFMDSLNKKLSVSTVHSIFRLLNSILKEAVSRQILMINPCQLVRKPKFQQKPPRVLSLNEQKKIEKKAIETGHLEYLLCLYTGIRLGELCALRWGNIDFEEGLLSVRETIQRIPAQDGDTKTALHFDIPKTATSMRDIPMPYFISDILYQRKKEQKAREEDFMFSKTKGRCMDPRTVQIQFGRMMNELKISGVHIHTLRHTYATRCLEKNIGVETLCELLGHSSPQVTLKCYAHVTMENKKESVNRLQQDFWK